MGSVSGDSAAGEWEDSNAHEEKIFVSVRLRPLNERELSRNEVSDWECINNATIIFKNSLQERTMLPTAYNFDRVFGCDCPTKKVYEEAAKKVALSVLSGINSSIFAYGQTSSGKTYTMTGVTEYSVVDIYNYINMHHERDFVLKFSAMEIYNESVRDLLSSDITPLRLLDDPERGTIVDKLSEVTLRDLDHLRELLAICEGTRTEHLVYRNYTPRACSKWYIITADQRQIGETNLNEMSSRSHQILRLTVESSAREYLGAANSSSLNASVNFIDLAGSECASQTLSAGTRLKEGCHINRSLLTLGTVIRKLSKGRNAHIPYRDSKLTRILQNCLGGNAKTAIICTMSPAHSHVEKTRNTLLFASCAKQVNTNARVNVVMSEKALVKQLQKELARLENELRSLSSIAASGDSTSALKEKEMLIEKMDKEIRELTQQRNVAQSRMEEMLLTGRDYLFRRPWGENHEKSSWGGSEYSASEVSELLDTARSDAASKASYFSDRCEGLDSNKLDESFLENSEMQFLSDDTSPREYIEKYFGPDPCKDWEKIGQETDKCFEDNCKEVQCVEIGFINRDTTATTPPSLPKEDQDSGQSLCSSDEETSDQGSANVPRSKSCTALPMRMQKSPSSSEFKDEFEEEFPEIVDDNQAKLSEIEPTASHEDLCRRDSETSLTVDEKEESIKILVEDCVVDKQTCKPCQSEMIKPKSQVQFEENLDLEAEKPSSEPEERSNMPEKIFNETEKPSNELEEMFVVPEETSSVPEKNFDVPEETSNEPEKVVDDNSAKAQDAKQSVSDWSKEFERQKQEIIELWDACNTPLVHRTYFLLLFKGDPSDAVYMEVELRRLSFLKNTSGQAAARTSRALKQEREMLSKQMLKKYSTKEREALFQKWGINLKSKYRRNQLCRLLWSDPQDMDHVNESAAIIAKLVGVKDGNHAPKEMFGLSFTLNPVNLKSYGWRDNLPRMI